MNSDFNEEKRSSPRVQHSLHLHLVYDDLDQLVEHYSRDISAGGIFIETDQPLPVGSKIQLRISIVHEDVTYINALGEVMHVIDGKDTKFGAGMGVKFVEIDPEGQNFLKEFVLSKLEKKPKDKLKEKQENKTGKKAEKNSTSKKKKEK